MEATALIPTSTRPAQLKREFKGEISAVGLSWQALKNVLPDWSDTAFDSLSGVIELKTFLSRNAGLRMMDDGHLSTRDLPAACFKTNAATSVEQVTAARSLTTACARLVAKATMAEYRKLPGKANVLRSEILSESDSSWITLSMLLDVCWAHGVPVLHMPSLPIQGRKMDGMVTFVCGRPAIIITKKVPHPDWLLFILAHEIGHIASDHLPEDDGQAIVDDTVDLNSGDDRDHQEKEANSFATHLLAPGGQEVMIGKTHRLPNAATFAKIASEYGKENGMAPGYVILNAVHNSRINGKKPYGLGQAALKFIPADGGKTAAELCKSSLKKHINEYSLRDDSIEFLEKLNIL